MLAERYGTNVGVHVRKTGEGGIRSDMTFEQDDSDAKIAGGVRQQTSLESCQSQAAFAYDLEVDFQLKRSTRRGSRCGRKGEGSKNLHLLVAICLNPGFEF